MSEIIISIIGYWLAFGMVFTWFLSISILGKDVVDYAAGRLKEKDEDTGKKEKEWKPNGNFLFMFSFFLGPIMFLALSILFLIRLFNKSFYEEIKEYFKRKETLKKIK